MNSSNDTFAIYTPTFNQLYLFGIGAIRPFGNPDNHYKIVGIEYSDHNAQFSFYVTKDADFSSYFVRQDPVLPETLYAPFTLRQQLFRSIYATLKAVSEKITIPEIDSFLDKSKKILEISSEKFTSVETPKISHNYPKATLMSSIFGVKIEEMSTPITTLNSLVTTPKGYRTEKAKQYDNARVKIKKILILDKEFEASSGLTPYASIDHLDNYYAHNLPIEILKPMNVSLESIPDFQPIAGNSLGNTIDHQGQHQTPIFESKTENFNLTELFAAKVALSATIKFIPTMANSFHFHHTMQQLQTVIHDNRRIYREHFDMPSSSAQPISHTSDADSKLVQMRTNIIESIREGVATGKFGDTTPPQTANTPF